MEDNVVENGAVKHANQFTRLLLNHAQLKYDNDMAEVIRNNAIFIY